MKIRVSDTDILETNSIDFIELDGRSISFHIKGRVYQSIYNNAMESMCVFNNIQKLITPKDVRFSTEDKPATTSERREAGWNMFWNLYDKKVDMKSAKSSFMNLTIAEMGEAIKGVKAYVDTTPNKKYRKNASSWINQKGWKNELKLDKDNKETNRYVKPKYITDER
tara:strand:- start:7250 stop:7750 length:501 start_codon:yes stop_codon:yes gene_type:complete